MLGSLQSAQQALDLTLKETIQTASNELRVAALELRRNSPLQRVYNNLQRHDDLRERLERSIQTQLKSRQQSFGAAQARLEALNPAAVLSRGFAIVTDAATGQIIAKTAQARPRQAIKIHLQDGVAPAAFSDSLGGPHANP